MGKLRPIERNRKSNITQPGSGRGRSGMRFVDYQAYTLYHLSCQERRKSDKYLLLPVKYEEFCCYLSELKPPTLQVGSSPLGAVLGCT